MSMLKRKFRVKAHFFPTLKRGVKGHIDIYALSPSFMTEILNKIIFGFSHDYCNETTSASKVTF